GRPLTNSPTMGRRLARGPPAGTQEGGRTTRRRMAGLLAHPSVAKAEARDAPRCYKAQVEAGRRMWSPPGGAGVFAGEGGGRGGEGGWDLGEGLVVRFEHVGLRYGLGPEVLRDLTFRIDERSFQFLTGPSGAGKTSLLRLLFLSLRPTRGLVTLFGHDIATLSK